MTLLKAIIKVNELGVIFLVETDNTAVITESDYIIPGFKTIIQTKQDVNDLTRSRLDFPSTSSVTCIVNLSISSTSK